MSEYVLMTDEQRANVQSIVDDLTKVGVAIESYTCKADNRQTGASVHFQFARKVDVLTTLQFVGQIEQAPAMLADACRKLLAADALAGKLQKENMTR